MSLTCMVTGGAGFIGSALSKALVAQGHRVVAFDNLMNGRAELLEPDGERKILVQEDLRDPAAIAAAMRKYRPQRVFHLAAIHFIPYCNAHPIEAVEVNVNGTRNLLRACAETRPEFVLFASTAAVYPIPGSPFAETQPAGPMDIYGHTKLAGEDLTRLFHLETGVRSVVARFFNAVGPKDTNPHLIPDIEVQLANGADLVRLGNLDPIRDYIHVKDMSAGCMALADRFGGRFDVFNIGAGEGFSVRDVVTAFAKALGREVRIEQDATRIRKVERETLVSNIDKMRKTLGWAPEVSFDDTIGDLVRAFGAR